MIQVQDSSTQASDSGLQTPDSGLGFLAVRFRAVRAVTLTASILPVPVAVAAALPVSQWDWLALVACTLGCGLLQCAGNLLNDYYDFRYKVDHRTEGDENRPGRVLVLGLMNPSQVLAEALACLGVTALLALYLVLASRGGMALLWFALAGGVSLYVYTGPPLKLKYHALGEPLIFLTFGPILMLGAAFAQTGRIELMTLLASIPVGFATTAILTGGNIRDQEEDRQAGIRTLTAVIGHNRMRVLYVALEAMAMLAIVGLAIAGLFPRVLIAAPVLLVLLAKPLLAVIRDQRLPDIDARTAQYEAVLLVAMILTLIFQRPVWTL